MRFAVFFAALLCAVLPAVAQSTVAVGTNKVYMSGVVTNRTWTKHVITEFIEGGAAPVLKDKAGKFVSAANLTALGLAVEDSGKVYDAWIEGFRRGCEELSSKIGQTPTSGAFLKFVFPLVPDATRRSVDIFVVSNEYDVAKNRDRMWIYCNRELPMEPVVEVPYVYESGFTTNRVKGTFSPSDVSGAHWTNTVTVTRFGHTYRDCRVLYATRPADLANYPCRLNRHGKWGRTGDGFEWGSVGVTVNGIPTLTAELTNTVQNKVMVFTNGGLTGIVNPEEKESEQ